MPFACTCTREEGGGGGGAAPVCARMYMCASYSRLQREGEIIQHKMLNIAFSCGFAPKLKMSGTSGKIFFTKGREM